MSFFQFFKGKSWVETGTDYILQLVFHQPKRDEWFSTRKPWEDHWFPWRQSSPLPPYPYPRRIASSTRMLNVHVPLDMRAMPLSTHLSSIVRSHFLSCSDTWNTSSRKSTSNIVPGKYKTSVLFSVQVTLVSILQEMGFCEVFPWGSWIWTMKRMTTAVWAEARGLKSAKKELKQDAPRPT